MSEEVLFYFLFSLIENTKLFALYVNTHANSIFLINVYLLG